MKKYLSLLLGVMLVVFFMATGAQADTISFDFTSDHMTGGAGVAPFGQVTLTENLGDVTFLVSLYDDSTFVRTGAGDFMDFKFNANDILVSDISGAGLTAATGDFDGDGGGMFHYGVYFTGQETGGSNDRSGPIGFTVYNSTINDFIDESVVALNGTGQIFVADIMSGQTGNTGLVDVSSSPVPEPTTMALFGAGLIGLAGFGRKRIKK